jgi:hypothetical protein
MTTNQTRPQFWPKPLNFDFTHFVVVQDFGVHGFQSVTTPFEDTRKSIIADIATGQFENVVAVFELNPVEGTSKVITADIAEAVIEFNAKRAA